MRSRCSITPLSAESRIGSVKTGHILNRSCGKPVTLSCRPADTLLNATSPQRLHQTLFTSASPLRVRAGPSPADSRYMALGQWMRLAVFPTM